MALELTSTAFNSGQTIPAPHTCEGVNISPPLAWRGVPEEAQSLVLICDDPDAPRGTFTHWVLYDMPARLRQLPEGICTEDRPAIGGTHGRNDFGHNQYEGPCPPRGDPAHHYYFRLYALEETLDLPPGASRAQVLDRIQGHVLDQTELIGLFARG